MVCKCGCGREVQANEKGRPSEYYSGACRVRTHRKSRRDATKVDELVTKCCTIGDLTTREEHHANTLEPGFYDELGQYWCNDCFLSAQLINLGKQLDWPEIFYFPDNSPGLQLTMVRPGMEGWYNSIAFRGKDAVLLVTDRARRLLWKREPEACNEKDEECNEREDRYYGSGKKRNRDAEGNHPV